jgi:hypothetical protein
MEVTRRRSEVSVGRSTADEKLEVPGPTGKTKSSPHLKRRSCVHKRPRRGRFLPVPPNCNEAGPVLSASGVPANDAEYGHQNGGVKLLASSQTGPLLASTCGVKVNSKQMTTTQFQQSRVKCRSTSVVSAPTLMQTSCPHSVSMDFRVGISILTRKANARHNA